MPRSTIRKKVVKERIKDGELIFKELKQRVKKLEGFLKDERMFDYRSKFLNSNTNETYFELFSTPWECYKLRQDRSVF